MKEKQSSSRRYEPPEFNSDGSGLVECNGLVMPADMSDELKHLNVFIDGTASEVTISKLLLYFLSFQSLLMRWNISLLKFFLLLSSLSHQWVTTVVVLPNSPHIIIERNKYF